MCTTKDGTIYLHSKKSLEEIQKDENGYQPSGPPDAIFGYSTDMSMYKSNDFRCLIWENRDGIKHWQNGHYEMKGYRDAKSEEELNKVKEIPFDENFFDFEVPSVLEKFTNGEESGLQQWKSTYGFDWAGWTDGMAYKADLKNIKERCIKAEYGSWAKDCVKKGGMFKCFAWQ